MPSRLKKSNEFSLIFNNLIEICDKHNIPVSTLVEEFSTSRSALQAWKNGKINADIIPKLSLKLNVSLDYLLTGKEKKSSKNQLSDEEREILEYFKDLPSNEQQQLIGMAKLLKIQVQGRNGNDEQEIVLKPVPRKVHTVQMTVIRKYNYPVAAGINTPPDKDDDYSNIKISDEYIPHNANSLVRVSGDSMEPDYPDGCWVWVNMKYPCDRNEYMGKAVIANNHGELLLKIAEEDGLHSINESYSIITDVEDCRIIGIVVEVAGEDVVEITEKYNK